MEYSEKCSHSTFKRYCKSLELRDDPQLIEAYKKAHSPKNLWPEIMHGIRQVGIIDMEIYIDGTRLFMIMDTVPEFDPVKDMERLASLPRQQEWETYMSQFQNSGADATADEKWHLVERIFKLP